jgi:hypothetical protein
MPPVPASWTPGIGSVAVGAGPAGSISAAPSLTTISDHVPRPTATVQNIIVPMNTSGSHAATRSPLPPQAKGAGRLERDLQSYM